MIPYLSTYTTSLRRHTGHLRSHKVVALPGPWWGNQSHQLTLISTKYTEPTQALTKILQQMSALVQISPTGVDPGSIVPSCRRSSRSGSVISTNRSEPQPNISNRCWGSDNLRQAASTSLNRRQGYAQLFPTYASVPQILSNCRHNSMNYCQPTPGLSNLEPWPPQRRLKYLLAVVLRHVCRRLSPLLWLIDWFSSFYSRVTCSLLLILVLWLNQRINPRANCLYTTAFLKEMVGL